MSSSANLDLAKANLDTAKANVENADCAVEAAMSLWNDSRGLAPSQYDIDKAADGVAKAQVGGAKASVGVAEAGIKQAQANLKSVQTDLDYCQIKSPVKGVIIDRRVNKGQTVVSASTRLQPLPDGQGPFASPDLGVGQRGGHRSHPRGPEGHLHHRYVSQRYLRGQGLPGPAQRHDDAERSNVHGSRHDGKQGRAAYPYMTANVNFEIERHEDVLKVPNAALRWKPRPAQIAPDIRGETLAEINRHGDKLKTKQGNKDKADEEGGDEKAAVSPGEMAGQPATSGVAPSGIKPEDWKARAELNAQQQAKQGKPTGAAQGSAKAKSDAAQSKKLAVSEHGPPGTPVSAKDLAKKKEHYETGYLWTADGNYVRPIKVRTIATDGTMTEVREVLGKDHKEPKLQDDTEVVTARTSPAKATKPQSLHAEIPQRQQAEVRV